MHWLVQIAADPEDLRWLSKSFRSQEALISEESDGFYLHIPDIEGLSDPDQVRAVAEEFAVLLSGAAALALDSRKPIEVAHVIRVKDDGTRDIFVSVHDYVVMRDFVSIEMEDSAGNREEFLPADPVPGWVAAGATDERVGRILRLYAAGPLSWSALYHVVEAIEEAIGGSRVLSRTGWVTDASLTRLKRTANSPSVLGPDARHGRERSEPPTHAMSLPEARSLVKTMVHAWLNQRATSTRVEG